MPDGVLAGALDAMLDFASAMALSSSAFACFLGLPTLAALRFRAAFGGAVFALCLVVFRAIFPL